MRVIVDIETDSLSPTVIWVVVCKDIDTGEIHIFPHAKGFREFARKVKVWVGHNLIDFDGPSINHILGGPLVNYAACIDTLVVSRLLHYKLDGGHSLQAWGQRLGCPKGDFSDFSQYSQEMVDYCVQDVEVTYKLYKRFEPYIFSPVWKKSLRVEHDTAILCREMHDNGFAFDIDGARSLHTTISSKVDLLTKELQDAFPPRTKFIREWTPKATKFGTISKSSVPRSDNDLTKYWVDSPFSTFEWVEFNPGSPPQRIDVLNEAGWKPHEKTKTHIQVERELRFCRDKREREKLTTRLEKLRIYGWTCSEENLATLPDTAPESAKKLKDWLILNSRRSTLEEWFEAYNEKDGKIHGRFNHIGAWTHRMSHAAPNMGNIPAAPSIYHHEFRAFWKVPDDKLLVGVDADGIQLRILAHYMEDERFTASLVSGKKEDGTDAHSLNKVALGHICQSRGDAKTFIYAWLLGAGLGKVAQILGCTTSEASMANQNFLEFYPGLKYLKSEVIPRDFESGYFQGIDGRLVKVPNEHKVLAGYLQNGESTVMKMATQVWYSRLTKLKIPFKLVNLVHDEWQTEVPNDWDTAVEVAKIQAEAIAFVGRELGLKCPLLGSWHREEGNKLVPSIGRNWSETH